MKAENLKKTIGSVLPMALLLVPGPARPQSCNSTGADGAYNPVASGVFDPVALKINAAGDNVFNFTSVSIPANVTITMQAHLMKSQRPVVFLVSGAVNIQGVLNLSGAAGNGSALQYQTRTASEPGPGGYPGGVGARPNNNPGRGAGPGSPNIPTNTGNGCSASYAYQGVGGTGCTAAPVYGNQELLPLVGGSGGSGAASISSTYTGAGGGAGGGAIRICSNTSITISQLYANGGNGGAASTGSNYGGAGSGGAIHLQSPTVTLNYGGGGYIQALGGQEPAVGNTSNGRIRIDANSLTGGATNPAPFVSSFLAGPYGGVPLPTPPTLTVVSVNGISVPVQPKNLYSPPDLAITPAVSGTVPIVIKTNGIPDNTTATFYIATDTNVTPGAPDIVTTAIVKSNTATLSVTLPDGVNRLFVRAIY